MIKINFKLTRAIVGIDSIESMDCHSTTTYEELYTYISDKIGGEYGVQLFFKYQQLPQDSTQLEELSQETEMEILVTLIRMLGVTVYIDGQEAYSTSVLENISIIDFVQQSLKHIKEDQPIQDFYLYGSCGQLLAENFNVFQTQQSLLYYTKGQHQNVFLNLNRVHQPPISSKLASSINQSSESDNDSDESLSQMIILPNVSLLIDPVGLFVAYKFHEPIEMSGVLRKTISKPKKQIKNIKLEQLTWIKNNSIRVAKINESGLIVEWNDETYSLIQIQ